MTASKEISTPLTDGVIRSLSAGDMIFLSGHIYTARDAAHKKLIELIAEDADMPFNFSGQAVYYAGPTPPRDGRPVGSIGPTTSGRMDAYSLVLIEKGLKVMIGKGFRSKDVIDAIVKHNGVYFAAVGGAAALLSKSVTASELVAFPELGTEAIRKLTVERMPLIVAVDCRGRDFYNRE